MTPYNQEKGMNSQILKMVQGPRNGNICKESGNNIF